MWRSLARYDLGLMNVIDRCLFKRSESQPDAFPDFSKATTVFAVSDYSGAHKNSNYDCYSFLYLSDVGFASWERCRLDFRRANHLGNRTFAFKKLRDTRKSRVLREFLSLAGGIDGLCAAVLVDKQLRGLLEGGGAKDHATVAVQWPKANYRKSVFEQLLRITHLNSFLLCGLVQPNQNVIWITDQDAIAANEQQLYALTDMFTSGMCRYLVQQDNTLPFTLGHIRCGTTASDDGSLQLEDLAAIPDLMAGAIAEAWTNYLDAGIRLRKPIDLPPPVKLSPKTRSIMGWMTEKCRLKRLVVTLEPAQSDSQYTVSIVDLIGSPALWVPRRFAN